MRGKDLCVNGENAKILTNYTIWDGLSQKTISRYCPFKGGEGQPEDRVQVKGPQVKYICINGLKIPHQHSEICAIHTVLKIH
jgi:hypothetical protein